MPPLDTTDAITAARYLIHLAHNDEEPDLLTPLRVQKLLYYVQGWHLALKGGPLFTEDIEAWAHGPVVPEVWQAFRGEDAIPAEEGSCEGLSEEQCDFIERVWETYRGYSAWSLRNMTHKEKPWKKARRGYSASQRCNEVIPHTDLKKFFESIQ